MVEWSFWFAANCFGAILLPCVLGCYAYGWLISVDCGVNWD